MTKLVFEWDADKAVANECDHGVAFEQGLLAFGDPFAVASIDDRHDYGEERMHLVGMSEGRLLHITYTERGDRIRIISARRAVRHEQDDYFRQNAT